MAHSSSSPGNATSVFSPSMELLMVVPRLFQKAGSLAEQVDNIFGKMRYGGSVIAEPTASNVTNATVITSASAFIQESLAATARATAAVPDTSNSLSLFQTIKNMSTFFGYMTSKWAFATLAIILNRTHFYASSRVPLSISSLQLRLALYILPSILFLYRIQSVLQAIRCQTSPDWSEIQYGKAGKQLGIDFAGEGGLLWRISSFLLSWQDVEASCKAVNMLPSDPSSTRPTGSLSLLWPLFISLAFSQFVETLSCSLQNRTPVPETSMSIFEHSLAFAEAESVVTKPVMLDAVRSLKPVTISTPDGTSVTLSSTAVSQFANVPPEVLLIALVSSVSHLSSNFLAILGLRARYRLVTTGIWGLAYMSAFFWSFVRASNAAADQGHQIGILRFPTVCIVGFLPHLFILMGIAACCLIYTLAFILTVIAPPPGQASNSLRDRISGAYRNLQANVHLSEITPLRLNWQEDFYTAILKCGFTVLTAASEAVYLNEGARINVAQMTWLEKKRLGEIIARRNRLQYGIDALPAELRGDTVADGVAVIDRMSIDNISQYQTSGYARERKTREANNSSDTSRAVVRDNGVGLQQRRGRWTLTYQFLRGLSRLFLAIHARVTLSLLRRLRIGYRPRLLRNLARPQIAEKPRGVLRGPYPVGVVLEMQDGRPELTAALTGKPDVESLLRQRLGDTGLFEEESDQEYEETLGDFLYNWWKAGGWWGDQDTSGDFVPSVEDDDDTTSVISMAPSMDEEWSDVDDGQRTPTREFPFVHSRENTPAAEMLIDTDTLSRLLDPKSQEEKEDARVLAHHLKTPGVLTRSQYRRVVERDQARVLTSSRFGNRIQSPEDEEVILEQFILEQRSKPPGAQGNTAAAWNNGADGMGADGPQCVVCQLNPRTVLVWPCGCLSLCDDCRVGLASKNYTTCVCCRTNVVAYSRLYVP
ncbi:hypothetical protein GQ43DRAFT_364122 [Delitschia confertaspora ATCC 74209]|uniref:Ubiquitin-protein ligase (Asi3) n=1 Tax=Delitschia confertaspora ATCC 74209 TaxID=1513339 RepID=A0A9P4MSY6_9PLEO|nr:hypothetical protein GQ43DRAFT_364122 [Delitschia confertaspora ATCC 74209]